jgi:hypothetical protein
MECWEPDSDRDTDDRTGDAERYHSRGGCQLNFVLQMRENRLFKIKSGSFPLNGQFIVARKRQFPSYLSSILLIY